MRVFEAYSDMLLALIESGELDFAFVAKLPDHPAISYHRIYRDRFVIVSGPKLCLPANKPVALDRKPYLKLVVLSLLRGGLKQLPEEPVRAGRIVATRFIEIDGLVGALQFIARTDWAALLPSAAARKDDSLFKVQVNPIKGEPIEVDYYIARSTIQPLSTAEQIFVDLMVSELAAK